MDGFHRAVNRLQQVVPYLKITDIHVASVWSLSRCSVHSLNILVDIGGRGGTQG